MTKHTIPTDELDGFTFEHLIAASTGRGLGKELLVFVHPSKLHVHLKVKHGDETVLTCGDFAEAVAAYNELP